MNFKNLSIALLLALICFSANAQVSEGGTPLSFIRIHELGQDVPTVEMHKVDVGALMKEDSLGVDKAQPYRFGYNHYVFITPENSGEWTTLKHGERIWRMGIKCPDALSINITFAKFIIPQGAKLFIYSKDRGYILGAFTSKNMQPDGQFGVDIVPGEEIVIEYNEPAKAAFKGQLNIFRITHAYRDLFKVAKDVGRGSGNCHNNVICPVGDPWRDEISSVALIVVNGNGACTGALINNANQDATPYFLSAYHCGTNVSTWVFRFNYQSTSCPNDVGAPTNQTISGATLRAGASGSDFTLLQLNSTPPSSYNVCYAGWSRSNVPPTSGACVHHPSGDVKKISFSTEVFDSTQWTGNGTENHWFVQWSDGVTEGGSSGSPLFDQNHRIVGQLHGGASYCGAPTGSLNDEYGKTFYSWDKMGNNANQRLKNWLDPNNTGLEFIDTYCPNQVGLPNLDASADTLILPANGLCDTSYTPGLVVSNNGLQTIASLTVSYSLDGNTIQFASLSNLNIAQGTTDTVYLPQITYQSGNHTYAIVITAVNNVADDVPNNNATSGAFTSSSGDTYTLTITTDDYGDETGFNVLDENGTIVYSIEAGTLGNNVTSTYNFCLPEGCYTFVAIDVFGDGMCCNFGNGTFTLTNSSNFTIATGGAFGFEQLFPFCTTLNTNDAAVDAILEPNGTQCVSAITPKVIIRNQGQQPLTQLSISFQIDGNAPGNYLWSGGLAFNQTDTVIIGVNTITTGSHTITVYAYSPNGQQDENTNNDTLTSSFSYLQGNTVTLNLTTDDYPGENAWTVINTANNNIVAQSPQTANPYLPNTTYKIELCLPNGCYKFIITDSEGDGICCANGEGSFAILSPNAILMGSGGEFTDSDTVGFCLPFVGVEENIASTLKVFPNPATGTLYLSFGEVIKESLIVEIINSQGQLVQTANLQNANMASVSVANLPSGFYMVRVYGQKVKPFTTTVIIKN